MARRTFILLFLLLNFSVQLAFGLQTSYLIGLDKLYVDAQDPLYQNVKPGDTLYFASGNRDYLLIKNFQGAPGKPIIMINSGGIVSINTDNYYGISIQNCRYFQLTGTGDPNQTYGFQIKRVANGAGIGIGDLSSDMEIDHLSIENTLIGGIYAKTDPDCSLNGVRGSFTQYNTTVHDNYIANTGNEGIYLGSSFYDGQTVQCNGQDLVLMPGLLDGVKVYNNTIKNSGWDGIQISSASVNCQIYNNTILNDSQAEVPNQMSGILIGGGTKCDCYNNFISQGKGCGIECHGMGGCRIFNNIIVDAGVSFTPADRTQMKHGIFISELTLGNDSTLSIQHNDIINPKSDGIRFSSTKSKNNLIASNVIINPGNFDYYQNGNTSFKGVDAYIMLQNIATEVIIQNNFLERSVGSAGFVSTLMQSPEDFKPIKSSPLVDSAAVDKNITFDFIGTPRPYGPKSDIGAFELEYDLTTDIPSEPIIQNKQFKLLKNPLTDLLLISIPNPSNAIIFLSIYNLKGEMVFQTKQSQSSANAVFQTNLSALYPGTYIYTIRTGDDAGSGKFIKR